jgi:hypothetical protein
VAKLTGLLGELPVMTHITLMHELSDRGPTWARLPATWPEHPSAEHMRCRSLRTGARRLARCPYTSPPPAPLIHQWRAAGLPRGPLCTSGYSLPDLDCLGLLAQDWTVERGRVNRQAHPHRWT